jgi:hypothetical protein
MTPSSDLYRVAERLDESPMELLNSGAADALRALDASAPQTEVVAAERDIDPSAMNQLWERAELRLRETPGPDEVFSAAAEAASLLYTAAWVLESESANTEDIRSLL